MASKRLVILAPYPKGQAPSQRFRYEQYLDYFEEIGFEIEFHPFLDEKAWSHLYKEGSFGKKAWGISRSFLRRWGLMFKLSSADRIFIHREASMIGPPIFEWIIAKVLRKKFIYDFDDAIWLPNYSESNARFHRLKAYGKVKKITKWAHHVSVGNEFLADFAREYNSNVTVIPTTIDLENVHSTIAKHENSTPIIGWTGSHTTMEYLPILLPVLDEIHKEIDFKFRVISNLPPEIDRPYLEFVKWNKSTEITDLAAIDIGVMPLKDSVWAKGKCGFKALQYMSLGIPAVVSPVGVNTTIVQHEENGFLCETESDWKSALEKLLNDRDLRVTLGKKGRETIQRHYSVDANRSNYQKILTT